MCDITKRIDKYKNRVALRHLVKHTIHTHINIILKKIICKEDALPFLNNCVLDLTLCGASFFRVGDP